MRLQILIPTLNEPFYIRKLSRLMSVLKPQVEKYPGLVDYSINDAGRSMTTGKKRNLMIAGSVSDYFVFIDSDDLISNDYLDEIMNGLNSNPDCVTMCGWMTTDGKDKRDWTIKLGSDYTERNRHYYRWPNHISVIRRAAVSGVMFPNQTNGEDYEWSKQVRDRGLLKSEFHIPKQIYFYDFITPRNRK